MSTPFNEEGPKTGGKRQSLVVALSGAKGLKRFFPFDKLSVRMTKSDVCGGTYKQPK